ncbi:phage protein [Xenorhabdus kozodoii]|uniref:Phage protein n=1 Tax=Xenorhabdus kozodoii TaxID=351676 RepID=A0A2D0LHM9_9GAMM|nr:hypothetical protein [Xenorhabdus kozodoii]PHM75113.1 phage protein [Xenorhabdus kozodoii]
MAKPDWEAIESAYRAGLMSLREIASQHGISEGAIRKRAKRDEWTRDLAAKVKSRSDDMVRKEEVRNQVRSETTLSERVLIEASAEVITKVRIAANKVAAASSVATGATITTAMAPAAAATSVATMGTAATLGMAAMTAAVPAMIALMGARKNGGPVSPNGAYRIGENNKPEIFKANNGHQYMIPGDRGKVISNRDVSKGGGGVSVGSINIEFNVQTQGAFSEQDARMVSGMVKKTIYDVLVDEGRPGGMLNQ